LNAPHRAEIIQAPMSVEERASATDRVLAARERYVARGVSTPSLVVDRAEGMRVWDVDGREFLDFAGGIACQNLGHGPSAVVAAVHEQVDRYLHQCFMVGTYEPYVELCRRLDELWPGDAETKSILLNSGAEAIENAVKIARAATGRPAVVVFERGFHGRTLLTLTMTEKIAYKKGFGPFAPEVYRAPAPYEYRGVSVDDAIAGLERLLKAEVDPASVACAVLEPVQGEGGFIPMPADYLRRLRSSSTTTGSSGSTTRCSRVSAAPVRCGRSRITASSPTCSWRESPWAAGYRLPRSRAARS